MGRLDYLRDDQIPETELVRAIRQRRGGGLLNLDRLLLHSPPVAAGWNQLLGAVRAQLSVPPRLRELAICAVAVLNEAPYEFGHHAPELLRAGGTQAQLDALGDVAVALEREDVFDETERAVLRLTLEMTRGVTVRDTTFDRLRHLLGGDDRQAFELVTVVAVYNMVSRLIVALRIEPEEGRASGRPAGGATAAVSGRMNVPGAAIAYRLEGPEEAPVLMLGNSLAADLSMWDDNVASFTRHWRVLRYDMRGHGASSTPPGPYTMAQLADDAIALLDALRLQRVHFLGLSLGGMVGQQLAARYPNRIASLVLCATMAEQPAPAAWGERMATVRRAGLLAIVEPTLARWFTADWRQSNPDAVSKVREMILETRSEGYIGCGSAIAELSQSALLARINTPCLVMAAEHDSTATPALAKDMAASIAGARLQVVPGAAHLLNIEQAHAFHTGVSEFLAGVGYNNSR